MELSIGKKEIAAFLEQQEREAARDSGQKRPNLETCFVRECWGEERTLADPDRERKKHRRHKRSRADREMN
eukprot:5649838-Amphidinium_carterae.2